MEGPTPSHVELLSHALVPVADEHDALATCRLLRRYTPDRVTALSVVETDDEAPVEGSEPAAEAALATVRDAFAETETRTETRTTRDEDVVGAITETATAVDASAIAFHPRGGSRLMQFLAGDRTLGLVTGADRPVVALQGAEEVPSDGDGSAG